jgi:ribosome biogenesis GTPase
LSPIHDPDDPAARRLTRLAARMAERGATNGKSRQRDERKADDRRAGRDRSLPDELGLEEDWETLPKREKHGRRRSEAIRRRADRLRLDPDEELPAAGSSLLPDPVTVVAVTRGQCEVEISGTERAIAHLPKALTLTQKSELAVGDRVLLERRSSGELAVSRLLPRRSRLSRPDPHHRHRERVLAANLDLAVVVASFRRPPFAAGLVDRFLVALAHGDVPALIAVNKVDLVPEPRAEDEEYRALEPYRELDLELVVCSSRTGEGLADLERHLAGRTSVFVGHSGVGKSSLLNALEPAVDAEVAAVSEGNARGRHTTTRARVYRLGAETRIVDTPGIREFGLWRMDARDLAAYFDEFESLPERCHFADCSHSHEPRCAVRAAAEAGELPAARYQTYLRILESLSAG